MTVKYCLRVINSGYLIVGVTPIGVCWVAMDDSREKLIDETAKEFDQNIEASDDAQLAAWSDRIAAAIDSGADVCDIPIDPIGTEFQKRVWHALRQIPAGQTITYGQLAERLGNVKSVRAAARACATNPASIVIPCHRVVGQNGSLTGYRWGIERKAALLAAENGVPHLFGVVENPMTLVAG